MPAVRTEGSQPEPVAGSRRKAGHDCGVGRRRRSHVRPAAARAGLVSEFPGFLVARAIRPGERDRTVFDAGKGDEGQRRPGRGIGRIDDQGIRVGAFARRRSREEDRRAAVAIFGQVPVDETQALGRSDDRAALAGIGHAARDGELEESPFGVVHEKLGADLLDSDRVDVTRGRARGIVFNSGIVVRGNPPLGRGAVADRLGQNQARVVRILVPHHSGVFLAVAEPKRNLVHARTRVRDHELGGGAEGFSETEPVLVHIDERSGRLGRGLQGVGRIHDAVDAGAGEVVVLVADQLTLHVPLPADVEGAVRRAAVRIVIDFTGHLVRVQQDRAHRPLNFHVVHHHAHARAHRLDSGNRSAEGTRDAVLQ